MTPYLDNGTEANEAVEMVLTRGLVIPRRKYERRDLSFVERVALEAPWGPEEQAILDHPEPGPMFFDRQKRIHLMLTTKDTSPSGLRRAARSAQIKAEAEAEDAARHAWLTACLKASLALEGGE